MFDAFKRLISNDDDAPAPDEKAAPAPAKARKSGPDRLTISNKGSLAIPDQAGDAVATPTSVPVPSGETSAPVASTNRARVPFTLGLGDLLRAKPMQHFVMLADAIRQTDDYDHHDIAGRYYEIRLPEFPGIDRFTSLTFWGFNFQGDHTVHMRVLDLDDQVIAELETPYKFRLERPSDTHESRTTWQVLFPTPGTYHLVVETDGRPTAVAPIFVSRSGSR
jgi:hypothetical protein